MTYVAIPYILPHAMLRIISEVRFLLLSDYYIPFGL